MIIEGERSLVVQASPDRLWSMVSDVTRMGEWSPETFRCEWLGEPGARVGAQFKGCNRLTLVGTWCSTATITACEPGRTFGFAVGKDPQNPNTDWHFSFQAAPEGATLLTEGYRMLHEPWIVKVYYRLIRRRRELSEGVTTTLQRLKLAAESDPPG